MNEKKLIKKMNASGDFFNLFYLNSVVKRLRLYTEVLTNEQKNYEFITVKFVFIITIYRNSKITLLK